MKVTHQHQGDQKVNDKTVSFTLDEIIKANLVVVSLDERL